MDCSNCGGENPERARFCLSCGAPLVANLSDAQSESRRTVTVLFCDLADSTALGEALDPERLRALLARYFERMKAIVERHGGSVEKFIGDAVMAVFGVPMLHEDDALRAGRSRVRSSTRVPSRGSCPPDPGDAMRGGARAQGSDQATPVAAPGRRRLPLPSPLDSRRRLRSAIEGDPR
ncbi:MAG: adenylate/guanylate cyclase domain-containing protein, partial [Candidatus Limnocylindria bacterium]